MCITISLRWTLIFVRAIIGVVSTVACEGNIMWAIFVILWHDEVIDGGKRQAVHLQLNE